MNLQRLQVDVQLQEDLKCIGEVWGDLMNVGSYYLGAVLSGSWGPPLATPHPYIVIKGPCLLDLSLPRLSRSHGKEKIDKNQP